LLTDPGFSGNKSKKRSFKDTLQPIALWDCTRSTTVSKKKVVGKFFNDLHATFFPLHLAGLQILHPVYSINTPTNAPI